MPFQVEWLIQDRIIHVKYQGDVSQPDITGITAEVERFIEAGTAPLYYIADLREIERVSGNPLKDRRNFTFVSHTKMGYVISCGHLHPMAAFFAATMRQVLRFQFQYKHFQTFEDGVTFLKHHDPSLEPSKDTSHAI